MRLASYFLIGLLFGLGLVVAGMSDPSKVLSFLDIAAIPTGGWDPSLAFVLGGAVAVTFVGYRLALRRPAPVFDRAFQMPSFNAFTPAIFLGPAIFGIGWGLVGLCPGPAFTALASGKGEAWLFVAAMLCGMIAARLIVLRKSHPSGAMAGR